VRKLRRTVHSWLGSREQLTHSPLRLVLAIEIYTSGRPRWSASASESCSAGCRCRRRVNRPCTHNADVRALRARTVDPTTAALWGDADPLTDAVLDRTACDATRCRPSVRSDVVVCRASLSVGDRCSVECVHCDMRCVRKSARGAPASRGRGFCGAATTGDFRDRRHAESGRVSSRVSLTAARLHVQSGSVVPDRGMARATDCASYRPVPHRGYRTTTTSFPSRAGPRGSAGHIWPGRSRSGEAVGSAVGEYGTPAWGPARHAVRCLWTLTEPEVVPITEEQHHRAVAARRS
jgi:hypothetical protein